MNDAPRKGGITNYRYFPAVLVSDRMDAAAVDILGASLRVIIVVDVCAYQVWTPVLDPAAPFLAPLIGGTLGLLSGTYPAMRAANLEPVEAFRN